MRQVSVTMVCLLVVELAAAAAPPPIFVNSRSLVLSFDVDASRTVEGAEIWVRTDASEDWTKVEDVQVSDGAARFETDRDGRHECYLSLLNSAGRSAPPPTAKSDPHVIVIVDMTPPTLQVHRTDLVASDNRESVLRLDTSLVEENLSAGGLRLFYRNDAGGRWCDGGLVSFGGGLVEWRPPTGAGGTVDIRIVATDLAGNRTMEEVSGVRAALPQRTAERSATTQPAKDSSPAGVVTGMVPTSQPDYSALEDGAEIDKRAEDQTALSKPADELATPDPRVKVLRRQAERFLAEGRLALAGARLRDALDLAPYDPDVNSDLGRVLYQTRQYAESGHRFQLALNVDPNHEAALEGLALTDFTQRRYSDARERLLQLVKIDPEDGEHWLHYGDVEHLLGNRAAATAAWERAMTVNNAEKEIRERAERRVKLLSRPVGVQ